MLATSPLLAQQNAPEQTFRVSSKEVLLDVVVRDKHQRQLQNLRPDEIEILEDGVPQQIRAFRFVRNESGQLLGSPGVGGVDLLHQLNLIAVVFQRMTNDGRRNAGVVMHDFVRNTFPPNTLIGMFGLTSRLSMLQEFTNQPDALHAAVDLATRTRFSEYQKISAEISSSISNLSISSQGSNPNTAKVDTTRWRPLRSGDASERGPESDALVAQLKARVTAFETRILNQVMGMADFEALLGLVRSMGALPGRKTVVLLSEGLRFPAEDPALLRSIIYEANRANVAFYTVNTNGLTTDAPSSADDAAFYRNKDDENLMQLAEETGGFGMQNSNDLRGPLRRVMEDAAAHYEVTYAPANDRFDGRFRNLEVRVRRPGAKVQTRDGYFALPVLNGQMLLPFELAPLAALDRSPLPNAFDFNAASLRFAASPGQVQHQVIIEVPGSAIRTALSPDAKSNRMRFSALALLKNSDGLVVDKIGRPVRLDIPVESIAKVQANPITLTLPLEAPPGRYTMEVALVDEFNAHASARRVVMMVPPAELPALSDVVVVGSTRPLEESDRGPMTYGNVALIPTLARDFERSRAKTIPLYFIAYGTQTVPSIEVELRRDGALVARLTPTTSTSTSAAVPFLVELPVEKLVAGQYDVTIRAREGNRLTQRMIAFQLH